MKLGLVCSPSLITGEPVASKRWIVSRSAASERSSSSACDTRPSAKPATASMSSGGRGMLPMGSVGTAIGCGSLLAQDLLLVRQDLLLVRENLVELRLVREDLLLVLQDARLVVQHRLLVGRLVGCHRS